MVTKKATKSPQERKAKVIRESQMPCCTRGSTSQHSGSGAYFLGFVGALVYYLTTATSFWVGVLGVLKAMVWPVFLVYGLLKVVGA